jgi:predicted negative regulator of RcsB-dependent stress response
MRTVFSWWDEASMVIIRKKREESTEEKEARLHKEKEQAMGIQDNYQARGFELVLWVQGHKVLVSTLIALLLLGGAILSGYLYYQKRSAEIASGAYLEVIKSIEGVPRTGEENIAKWQKAQTKLMELAAAHKYSGIAVLANLYGAHLALENNDAKNAVEMYQMALSRIKKSDNFYPLALIGLGYAQEKNGDVKSAIASFESVIEIKGDVGKDLALWEAARLSSELHENDNAKKNIAKLLEEYPASVYEKNAKRLKDTLH